MGAMGIGIDISRCSTLDWGSVLMVRVLVCLPVRSCRLPPAWSGQCKCARDGCMRTRMSIAFISELSMRIHSV